MLTPIARWDMVPYQRITGLFKLGVVAFSKPGIASVAFSFNGGAAITVTGMTLNDRVNVWEYWTTFDPSVYADGDFVTLDATVTGNDGGTRVLPTLTIVADASGTWRRVYAWVDVAGDDNTGVASPTETGANPYLTIGAAAEAIRVYRNGQGWGNDADGAFVYLNEGTHQWISNADYNVPGTNEWLIITTAPGATKLLTKIIGGGFVGIQLAKVAGVLVEKLDDGRWEVFGGNALTNLTLWIDNVSASGWNQWSSANLYVGNAIDDVYYTDSDFTVSWRPTRDGAFARNITIDQVGSDSFVQVPVIINCVVSNSDPGATGEHTDVVQFFNGAVDDNVIIYGLKATNLSEQGIFWRGDDQDPDGTLGAAIVNVLLQAGTTTQTNGLTIRRSMQQLIMWHVTILSDNNFWTNIYPDSAMNGIINQPNMSVIGCVHSLITNYTDTGLNPTFDYAGWDNNHNTRGTFFPGTNMTTGDPIVDVDGRPQLGSPLLGRVSPVVVNIDYDGINRGEPTAAGYLRGINESNAPLSPTNLQVTVT